MNTYSVTEARARFAELLKASRKGVVRITERNLPSAAVLDWEMYESLMESLEILSDPDLMNSIQRSETELSTGKLIDWETFKKSSDS